MKNKGPKIIAVEKELATWFRKNLSQFGYIKALVDPSRGIYPSYPDYWCIKEDGTIDRVELESLSYNFYLHGHDPADVDKVVCAENNCHLYGADTPPNLITLHWLVNGTQEARCLLKINDILNKEGHHKRKALFYTLTWRQPPGNPHCFHCGKSLGHSDRQGKIHYSLVQAECHEQCMKKAESWLLELLMTYNEG